MLGIPSGAPSTASTAYASIWLTGDEEPTLERWDLNTDGNPAPKGRGPPAIAGGPRCCALPGAACVALSHGLSTGHRASPTASGRAARLQLTRPLRVVSIWGVGAALQLAVCSGRRVLPVVAVQIAPQPPAPELEERLLSACSTGLRARCVAARAQRAEPAQAVAVVAWTSATRVQIEVGLPGSEQPVWVSRALDFVRGDPEIERWRSIGFTIAVLADDERLWPRQDAEQPVMPALLPLGPTPLQDTAAPVTGSLPLQLDVRALGGAGLVGGALRLGAEVRGWFALAESLGLTSSVNYSVAGARALDVRWLDLTLGLGLESERLWHDVGARLRLEALLENVSALAERGSESERASAWVPGLVLGSDWLWRVSERWSLSVRVDGFWLDGATAIRSAGERLGTSAGAGVLLGVGAGCRF